MNIVLNKKKLFSLNKKQKKMFFEKQINLLTQHHYKKSKSYKQILDFFGYKLKNQKLNQIPFLPAQLFKKFELISVPKKKYQKFLFLRVPQVLHHLKFIWIKLMQSIKLKPYQIL